MGKYGKQYAVRVPNLPENIYAGITTSVCDDMGVKQHPASQWSQNRKLADKLGASHWMKLIPEHGDKICIVMNSDLGACNSPDHISEDDRITGQYHKGDGIVHLRKARSNRKVVLMSPTADCPTVMISNGRGDMSAIIHSGRKGTHLGIVPKAVDLIERSIGIIPEQLHIALVPGISWQNYEVSPEIAEEFNGTVRNRRHIDLKDTILNQLSEARVPEKNISMLEGFCSFESQKNGKLFYSYRATGTKKRNAGFICS